MRSLTALAEKKKQNKKNSNMLMDDRRGLHVDTETDVYFLEAVFVKRGK